MDQDPAEPPISVGNCSIMAPRHAPKALRVATLEPESSSARSDCVHKPAWSHPATWRKRSHRRAWSQSLVPVLAGGAQGCETGPEVGQHILWEIKIFVWNAQLGLGGRDLRLRKGEPWVDSLPSKVAQPLAMIVCPMIRVGLVVSA